MKRLILGLVAVLFLVRQLNAQTFTDGLMMPKKDFCTGILFTTDQWKDYWEGSLKRDNQNIGTISTSQIAWMGSYGLTDKINLIAVIPYIKTHASGGTLKGLDGIQDLTIGIKYNLLKKEIGSGTFSAFGIGSFSTPLTNYTPDFLPLSIGMASTTISGRLSAYYRLNSGWYANASAGYVWRSNVLLDRPSYFTDGTIYYTNQVWMPNQITATYSIGYQKNALIAEVNTSTQNTLGGGDIRRQDMPFVSNRMNFLKLGIIAMYYLPKPKGLAVRAQLDYTLNGINVGQATTLTGGLFYTIHFAKKENQ
jgi:Putative MetA-pathway of phenol degradation